MASESQFGKNKKVLSKDQRCRPEGGHWPKGAVKSRTDVGNTLVFLRESQSSWGGESGKSLTLLWSNIMRAQILSFRIRRKR